MSSVRHCTLVRSWAAERRTNSIFLLGAIFCTANKSVSTQWSAGVAVSRVVRPSNITAARAAAAAAATATTTTTSAMWKIVMVSSTCALFAPTGQSSPPRRRVQSGAYFCTRVHGKARVRELLMALQIVLRCYSAVWSCSYFFVTKSPQLLENLLLFGWIVQTRACVSILLLYRTEMSGIHHATHRTE